MAGMAACMAQTDSVVRQYTLPEPRVTHQAKKEEPKTPGQTLRDLVAEPREAELLPIPLTLPILSTVITNFEKNGSPLVRDLVKEHGNSFDLFVITEKGVYQHDPEKKQLNLLAEGDCRDRFVGERKELSEAKCFLVATVKSLKALKLSQELRETRSTLTNDVRETIRPDDHSQADGNEEKSEEKPLMQVADLQFPQYAILLVAKEYDFDTK